MTPRSDGYRFFEPPRYVSSALLVGTCSDRTVCSDPRQCVLGPHYSKSNTINCHHSGAALFPAPVWMMQTDLMTHSDHYVTKSSNSFLKSGQLSHLGNTDIPKPPVQLATPVGSCVCPLPHPDLPSARLDFREIGGPGQARKAIAALKQELAGDAEIARCAELDRGSLEVNAAPLRE